jgi:hypothetical protein
MIVVRASICVLADDDKVADAWLQASLKPQKGLVIQIVESSRELVDGR